ncbi:hypothetical protein MNBD_PLANCTO02-2969 [hydrothermal vent metagenome]|uniref:Calcineurin-like phosphoesterase domain-containing protein n=1 Tax=hydrothermal vent metagenome TaxID=652676 RepID=A0A3B1DCU6_9ZZZZ
MRMAFFGGIYNNYIALEAALRDATMRGAEQLFCLGDIGAFGPHPNRTFPLLQNAGVQSVQGNYDDSIGNHLDDCQCGYTDPRDNLFAQKSYDYTLENTSKENCAWLRQLPKEIRLEADGIRILLCHGSPQKTNEFLWESATSTHYLEKMTNDCNADLVLGTHTGLHWQRKLSGGKRFINVGVLGRPENDGKTNVWYTLLTTGDDVKKQRVNTTQGEGLINDFPFRVEFVPLEYDYKKLATEMQEEKLPPEFIETILTGWWTTCLEVLPSRERRRGKF